MVECNRQMAQIPERMLERYVRVNSSEKGMEFLWGENALVREDWVTNLM